MKPDKDRKRYILILISIVTISWSIIMGSITTKAMANPIGTKSVDMVAERHRVGKEIYLENCSTCHIAIPPAVLPTETWKTILENPLNHYGTRLEGIIRFNQVLMWQYLSTYSRPISVNETEPKFIAQSRYFFALHPGVEVPSPVSHTSCVECHSRVSDFDFRTLTEEWQ
ncbi:diheme cytochrome c family protein [Cyanobacterium stanieri LEGE 03274]|uniref:Diheme cytochrome c family protein n=1 Tax=Cyanobacterium stanieri LEGE 03274 TaxID=1828756 RepID=A0ABR9V3G7_9CHRO|nr:dihem cytochrome c family protein [Cyanobacterium stanieri]MBE9221676.1 diheme cytochrome c family protein [Cyanobacterium stanieri LEGE 03274]